MCCGLDNLLTWVPLAQALLLQCAQSVASTPRHYITIHSPFTPVSAFSEGWALPLGVDKPLQLFSLQAYQAQEPQGLLMNGVGDPVMKDREKAEICQARFPLVFTIKVSPQASQTSMPRGKIWGKRLPALGKGCIRVTLAN